MSKSNSAVIIEVVSINIAAKVENAFEEKKRENHRKPSVKRSLDLATKVNTPAEHKLSMNVLVLFDLR